MKMSKMHIHTLREVPAEAVIPSHILMLRSGFMKKMASGVYNFMPMGIRVINKVEQIIREEMEKRFPAIFALPEYSCDNAAGIAVLTQNAWSRENEDS